MVCDMKQKHDERTDDNLDRCQRVVAVLQAFEHLRQHVGDHGEVHQHARVTGGSADHTACRGEEENRGAAAQNAPQVYTTSDK